MLTNRFEPFASDMMISKVIVFEGRFSLGKTFDIRDREDFLLFDNTEGERDYFVNGRKIMTTGVGDIMLIPPHSTYFTITTSPSCAYIGVRFCAFGPDGNELPFENKLLYIGKDHKGYYKDKLYQLREHYLKEGFNNLLCKSMLYEMLFNLSIDLSQSADKEHRSLLPAIRYMENNLHRNCDVDQLARLCFMSHSTFFRRFKQVFSVSPLSYHMDLRLKKCREMLSSGLYSASQVSEIMGFCDNGYFCRVFKQRLGIRPSDLCRHPMGDLRPDQDG